LDVLTLEGGAPFYTAFLEDTPVADKNMVRQAKEKVKHLIEHFPEAVKLCAGKSPTEARRILEEAENTGLREAA